MTTTNLNNVKILSIDCYKTSATIVNMTLGGHIFDDIWIDQPIRQVCMVDYQERIFCVKPLNNDDYIFYQLNDKDKIIELIDYADKTIGLDKAQPSSNCDWSMFTFNNEFKRGLICIDHLSNQSLASLSSTFAEILNHFIFIPPTKSIMDKVFKIIKLSSGLRDDIIERILEYF